MLNIPNKVPGDTHFSYEFNSYVDELENVVTDINVALNGADSHQVGQSMAVYGATGNYFVDSGIANALNLIGSQYNFQVPKQYYDGMLVRCLPAFTNTGASTMNVAGIGNKNIKLSGGVNDVLPGDIVAGVMTSFYYSLAHNCMIFLGTQEQPLSVPFNYFSGLLATFAATTMSWGQGSCSDSTNQQMMYNGANFTKDYTLAWAPGNGNGGVPSAIILANNTFYYDFIISKPDGTVDFGLDTSITAVNLMSDAGPFGFTRFRRTHSHTTRLASTQNELMFQCGREFIYYTYRHDFSQSNTGTIDFTVPLSVPIIPILATFHMVASTSGSTLNFHEVGATDAGEIGVAATTPPSTGPFNGTSNRRIFTNNGNIIVSANGSTNLLDGFTIGWFDPLDG
jgi:hypothetical protein